jgi:hypothetical protein
MARVLSGHAERVIWVWSFERRLLFNRRDWTSSPRPNDGPDRSTIGAATWTPKAPGRAPLNPVPSTNPLASDRPAAGTVSGQHAIALEQPIPSVKCRERDRREPPVHPNPSTPRTLPDRPSMGPVETNRNGPAPSRTNQARESTAARAAAGRRKVVRMTDGHTTAGRRIVERTTVPSPMVRGVQRAIRRPSNSLAWSFAPGRGRPSTSALAARGRCSAQSHAVACRRDSRRSSHNQSSDQSIATGRPSTVRWEGKQLPGARSTLRPPGSTQR